VRLVAYISMLLIIGCSYSQAQTFVAKVSKSSLKVGEQFKLQFVFDEKGQGFKAPDLSAFRVYAGPNQSSSMKWVNGVVSNNLSFSYVLSPKAEGNFEIKPASVTFKGKSFSSQPIKIKVSKAQSQSSSVGQNQSTAAQSAAPKASNGMDKNVFLRVQVSKLKPYEGEQVIATYKLYYRIDVINIEAEKLPAFKGFSSYDVNMKNNNMPQEIVNGVRYNVAAIQQVVLFPQRSGELVVDALQLKTIVRVVSNRRPRSVFDQFFGSYQDVEHLCQSPKLKLQVRPLPNKGKPANFKGAVGSYSFNTELDKDSLAANDAMNLKVLIKGRGDINLLPEPAFKFPADFEVYDPKLNTSSVVSPSGIKGRKSFEYLVIPRHSGKFKIESEGFSYFDPKQGKYVSVASKSYDITVDKVEGEEENNTFRASKKEDIKFVGSDIRYIKTEKQALSNLDEHFYRSAFFWALLLLPSLLMLIAHFVLRQLMKGQNDIALIRRRKAASMANKHLAAASKALKENSDEVYEAISIALYGYLSNKLNIDTVDLNRDNIKEELANKQVSASLIKELEELLNSCDMARFSPSAAGDKQALFDQSKSLINQLENTLS